MTPDVTVIVPAYNAMPYMSATLASVFGQTIGFERIELIVVDDGSTDSTAAELERAAIEHPTMTVVRQENSGGPARPRNVGLERATGRYVFFLDADDLINPECLERMVRYADANASDVVLGKMVGGGGRRPPRSMFTSTQPNVSVFESRVWWALNTLKLFRREFVERLALRFHEDMFAEDQPFTGMALLNASVISVLADYDYITFVWREDGGNMTLWDLPLSRLTDSLRVMLDLIVENVEPGPKRNHLLTRHLEVEVFKLIKAMAASADADSVQATFDLLRSWVEDLFPRELVSSLPPTHRVAYTLLIRGERERLLDFIRGFVANPGWRVEVDGGRVHVRFPQLLGDADDLPEECFDATSLVKVRYQLSDISWSDRALRIAGNTWLDLFEDAETHAALVLRERTRLDEFEIPVTRAASPGCDAMLWQRPFTHEDAGFIAEVDPMTAAAGSPIAHGVWDVSLRLTARGIARETRIGRVRPPALDTTFRWRLIPSGSSDGVVVGAYHTQAYDNLSLDIGGARRCGVSWVTFDPVRWDASDSGTIALSGSLDVIGLRAEQSLRIIAVDESGREHEAAIEMDGSRFSARLDLRAAVMRSGLRPGRWAVVASVDAGRCHSEPAPRSSRELVPVWVRVGLWPYRMRPSAPDTTLTLRVDPMSPILLARRIGRALKR